MRIDFKMSDVLKLTAWNAEHTQKPSSEQIFDPGYYPDGMGSLDEWGNPTGWLDTSALPAALHLVKDHGLYLMAGTVEPMPPEDPNPDYPLESFVVYARGCDPDRDRHFHSLARAAYGADEGDESVLIDWVREAMDANPATNYLTLDITPTRLALLAERTARRTR